MHGSSGGGGSGAGEGGAVQAVGSTALARALMHPLRLRVLASLREPASATEVGRRLGVARQRVNYHVRELERLGVVREVERVRRRNLVERRFAATADAYVLLPDVLGQLAPDRAQPAPGGPGPPGPVTPVVAMQSAAGAARLLALTARTQSELARAARQAGARGARLTGALLEIEVRLSSAADRARLIEAVGAAVAACAGAPAAGPAVAGPGAGGGVVLPGSESGRAAAGIAAVSSRRVGRPQAGWPHRLVVVLHPIAEDGAVEP
jgi:DNA-binding transcriptional ArsR family regulator